MSRQSHQNIKLGIFPFFVTCNFDTFRQSVYFSLTKAQEYIYWPMASWIHRVFSLNPCHCLYIVYFAVVEGSINIFITKATFNTYIEHLGFYICLKISIACTVKHACNKNLSLFSTSFLNWLLKWLIIEPTIAAVRCNGSFACFLLLVTLIKYQTRNNKN